LISFNQVSLIYPQAQKTIFNDLTFSVPEGELLLIMGQTGSGKSSLLKLINGLVPHHTGGILSGEITVAGRSTRMHRPRELADLIGIVGQNPAEGFVTDTVEEEIAFGMESLGVPREVMRKRVEETLDLLGLAQLRNRSLSTLSGGEAQRVAIAAVLTMHPKVLLLDEPTSALDPIAAEEVLSILARLVHDLGLTIIIAEHRLERVLQFVDRIIHVLGEENSGQVRIGLPEEIMAQSQSAPPVVLLGKDQDWNPLPLTVRDARRLAEPLREKLANLSPPIRKSAEVKSLQLILEIKKLVVEYEKKVAVKGIDLEVSQGEVVAIMGRNGAGKSSLLGSAVGITPIKSGQVLLDGKPAPELKGKSLISLVGFVPQEATDLLYGESVLQECAFADRDSQVAPGTTYKILNQLLPDISEIAHPRDLSEGQRLCLVLAIVLAAAPKLLILDEPTRGLDYSAKLRLIKILRSMANEGRSVILATHDVELVAEVATRVVFMAEGEKIADGSTLDILTSSPAFAPQISKILAPGKWLTFSEITSALEQN
jgi:energy-coupling factor transport system ATP-binding protein